MATLRKFKIVNDLANMENSKEIVEMDQQIFASMIINTGI